MDLHVKMNFIYVEKRERSKFKKRFIERERERERRRSPYNRGRWL
jgi:hypothetical protein